MSRLLTLHQLSLRDVAPAALPGVARAAGFDAVSVFLHPPAPQLDIFPRVLPAEADAFAASCRDAGVAVHNIEALPFSGRTDPDAYLPVLDLAARIGAARATALVYDSDHARAGDRLARTCDAAAARGIALSIEFMSFSSLRTVGEAAAFVRATGHPNLSLLVDPLHLHRAGGDPSDLPALADTIGCLQFCDAPLAAPEDPFAEAVENRAIPGEGALPLQALLDACPGLPLDVEVPMLRLQQAGIAPLDRALRLRDSLRAYRL